MNKDVDKIEVKSKTKKLPEDGAKRRRQAADLRRLRKPALIILMALGVVVFCCGVWKIHGYYARVGNKSVEELSVELDDLSEEYEKVEAEKIAEIRENGYTDKYIELNNKSAELSSKMSKATQSQYMKETGYENPQSLDMILSLAPELWMGVMIVAAGVVGWMILNKDDKMRRK